MIPEKDPYDFVDSSTVSSLCLKEKKGQKDKVARDTVGARRTRRPSLEQDQGEDAESGNVSQELVMVEDSQDDFVSHSHKFGPASKGSAKKQKKKEKSGQRRSSGIDDGENEMGGGDGSKNEEDRREDKMELKKAEGKCPTPSRKRMKGKLDSDDEYVQRIEKETSKSAEFVKKMEELDADEFPDVEVARDVARVTTAYHDRDITEFVSSVMKSLPHHKTYKGLVKKEKPVVGRALKRKERDEVEFQEEGDMESRSKPCEITVDADMYKEDTNRDIGRSKLKKGTAKQMAQNCLESSREKKPTEKPETLGSKCDDAVALQDRSQNKSSRRQSGKHPKDIGERKVTSQKKVIKPASSARNKDEESLTEGETSMDDLLNAHLTSVLGSCEKGSRNQLKRRSTSEEQEEIDESYMTKKNSRSGMMDDGSLEYEMDEVVLQRAEESISRRSRMIAALEHSSATQSDGEEVAETCDVQTKAQKQVVSKKKGGKSDATHSSIAAAKKSANLSRTLGIGGRSSSAHKLQPVVSQKLGDDVEQVEHSTEESEEERKTDEEFEDDTSVKKPSKLKKTKEGTENQGKRIRSKETREQEYEFKEAAEKRKKNNRLSAGQAKAQSSKSPADQIKNSACPAKKAKTVKESRTHFGSQIMDSDTEETDSRMPSPSAPDDAATVVSVESFSNMCKVREYDPHNSVICFCLF